MSEQQKKITQSAVLLVLLASILAATLIAVVGLLNGNFFPKKVPTEVEITKSPFRIVYKGENKIGVNEIIKDIKEIPFVDYKFNSENYIKIETQDVVTNASDTKLDISEKSENKINQTKENNE